MALNYVMPVKSVVIPPSIEQGVRVRYADATLSSIDKAGLQKLAYYAARMSFIQTGAGGQNVLPCGLSVFEEQTSRYPRTSWPECALWTSWSAEAVGIAQVLIEDTRSDDSRVS